jgi:hypothetical protein
MLLPRLREEVLEANLELVRRGLVLYTFGNVSGISREQDLVVIKPSGVPYEEMEWDCAGINHLAWFTTLKHQGRDLYKTVLYEKFSREVEQGIHEAEAGLASHDNRNINENVPWKGANLIRKDMCVQFGAFITESSGHLSEYLPYYRKSDAGKALLRLGFEGGSRFYATNWPTWRNKPVTKPRCPAASTAKTTPVLSLDSSKPCRPPPDECGGRAFRWPRRVRPNKE